MACPRFEDHALCHCTAVAGSVVPSVHERERWCLTENWARCPTYRARALRASPLPEEAYYEIWLPAQARPWRTSQPSSPTESA